MSYMERELYHILGIYLNEAREKSGLTLADVSEMIGATPMTVQRYEKGDRKISIEKVRELCHCYGVDADSLMQKAASEFKSIYTHNASEPNTIAAHHESEDWTPEELEEIEKFKEYVKSKRK
ncbi:MAG: helix-turn-helix domain-containing protein [Anaerovoracaceae bacterium]